MKYSLIFFYILIVAILTLPQLIPQLRASELPCGKWKQLLPSRAYATKLFLYARGNMRLIEILRGKTHDFYLYGGEAKTCKDTRVKVLPPIKKLALLSTTHIAMVSLLGGEDRVVALPALNQVYSDSSRALFKKYKALEFGYPIKNEVILMANPDLIVSYNLVHLRSDIRERFPVLNNADYLEKHPLGRAEWLIFFGILLDREAQAIKIYSKIRQNYEFLRQRLSTLKRPKVAMGALFGGRWIAPAKGSYMAKLVEDAGGDYLWKGQENNLSFEKAFKEFKGAVFWLPQNLAKNIKSLLKLDSRYKLFCSDKVRIFNNTKKVNKHGVSDFWESAVPHADLLLADLAKIFHPEIVINHQSRWYVELK